jgi:hypothetical protein
MSQQIPKPPFGTVNINDEVISESVSYNAGNIAVNISDEIVSENVSYNAGNVAVNVGDEVVSG